MKKMLFIINPKAGRTAIKNDLFEIIMTFTQADYDVRVYPTTGPDDAEKMMCEEGSNYDLVVCAGGDGTLENVVCGYMKMENKVPIGYIPAGTTNDFARSIKISRKPLVAANQIVNGEAMPLDVGRFFDKYFIYIAAFGIFTDISYTTNQSLKKVMGHSAYILEAIKNIPNYKGFKIEAQFDAKHVTGEYIYGMITNSLSVAGFKIRGAKHVILDDGKFDCLLVKMPKTVAEMQQILTALLTNNIYDNEMFFECKANKVIIKSEEEIPWTVDGEYGGSFKEAEIYNENKAVDIFVSTGDNYEDEEDSNDDYGTILGNMFFKKDE